VNSTFLDFYRCPERFANFTLSESLFRGRGFFRFGADAICYGQCWGGSPCEPVTGELYDAMRDVVANEKMVRLSFNPSEVIANLRYERYQAIGNGAGATFGAMALRKAYYCARPLLPVWVRRHLQSMQLKDWKKIPFPAWPVDATVERILERLLVLLLKAGTIERIPFIWFWPNGASSAAIMTHDVETEAGRDSCSSLMDLDHAYGIRSSFQIIPERRYAVSQSLLDEIRRRGFEINVHDLNHDGRLFDNREEFLRRAERINRYGQEFGASGFRSAVLYRNLDWYGDLNFSYDMSVPSVGHLEARRGGCCSVMPYFIGKILELPLTTTQDYSLFYILHQYSIDLWKCQAARIMNKHGLISFIVHPDYLIKRRARETYNSLLAYLAQLRSEGKIWIALPGEVNQWWRARSQMKLVWQGNGWGIVGPQNDQARVAYAVLQGGQLAYEFLPRENRGVRQGKQCREREANTLPSCVARKGYGREL
jgi:hypothetical protein